MKSEQIIMYGVAVAILIYLSWYFNLLPFIFSQQDQYEEVELSTLLNDQQSYEGHLVRTTGYIVAMIGYDVGIDSTVIGEGSSLWVESVMVSNPVIGQTVTVQGQFTTALVDGRGPRLWLLLQSISDGGDAD